MSKIFHRKSKTSNLNNNIVEPQNCRQENKENCSSKLNQISNNKQDGQFRTIDHLKSYPIVQETQAYANNCAVARVFIANTEPILVKILNSKPLKIVSPITNFVDKIGYSSIRLTEKLIPSIKTKTFKNLGDDFMIPVKKTKNITKRIKLSMVNKSQKYVYKPTHSRIIHFRKYYNEKIYDTKGKPLIRGTFDPVILPLNNAFENSTHKYFPAGKTVSGSFSCEFDRSVALSFRLIQNIIPLLGSKVKIVLLWPFVYFQHVNSVFNKHLDKEPNLCLRNSRRATYGSVKELYHDFLDNTKKKAPLRYFTKKTFKDEADIRLTDPITVVRTVPHDIVEGITSNEEVPVNNIKEHIPSPYETVITAE